MQLRVNDFECQALSVFSSSLCSLQLSALLADVGLNIREAHVFSTVDGYSLDVFVVDGWSTEVGISGINVLTLSLLV